MAKKSIVENTTEECYVCGAVRPLERHHIYGGNPGRKLSERYGLTIHLCCFHHRDSKEGVHFNKALREQLQEEGQRAFEKIHTREEFLEVFGRNYITREEEARQQDGEEEKAGQQASRERETEQQDRKEKAAAGQQDEEAEEKE